MGLGACDATAGGLLTMSMAHGCSADKLQNGEVLPIYRSAGIWSISI